MEYFTHARFCIGHLEIIGILIMDVFRMLTHLYNIKKSHLFIPTTYLIRKVSWWSIKISKTFHFCFKAYILSLATNADSFLLSNERFTFLFLRKCQYSSLNNESFSQALFVKKKKKKVVVLNFNHCTNTFSSCTAKVL